MKRTFNAIAVFGGSCVFGLMACAVETPLAPAVAPPPTAAAADGSTLKVTAPGLVSPVNSDTLLTPTPTLVVSSASGPVAPQTLSYQFELQTDAGAVVGGTTQGSTSWVLSSPLPNNQAFRWRARAALQNAFGPWSSFGRFQTPKMLTPVAASSNDEWKTWFFAFIDLRGVGPIASSAALRTLQPDLVAASVILETNSAGDPRGRLYLPTGNPNNLYGRSVDLGDFGKAWQWLPRGGTVCEGGNCPK